MAKKRKIHFAAMGLVYSYTIHEALDLAIASIKADGTIELDPDKLITKRTSTRLCDETGEPVGSYNINRCLDWDGDDWAEYLKHNLIPLMTGL